MTLIAVTAISLAAPEISVTAPLQDVVLEAQRIELDGDGISAEDAIVVIDEIEIQAAFLYINLELEQWELLDGSLQDEERSIAFSRLTISAEQWTVEHGVVQEELWELRVTEGVVKDPRDWLVTDGELGYCPCPESQVNVGFSELSAEKNLYTLRGGEIRWCEQPIVSIPTIKVPQELGQIKFPRVAHSPQGWDVSIPINSEYSDLQIGVLSTVGPYVDSIVDQHRFLVGLDIANRDNIVGVSSMNSVPIEQAEVGWRWKVVSHPQVVSTIWRDANIAREVYFPMESWFNWKGVQFYALDAFGSDEHRVAMQYQDGFFWNGGGVIGGVGSSYQDSQWTVEKNVYLQQSIQRPYFGFDGQYTMQSNELLISGHIPFYGDLGSLSYVEEVGVQWRYDDAGHQLGPALFFYGDVHGISILTRGMVYIGEDDLDIEGKFSLNGANLFAMLSLGEEAYGLLAWNSERAVFYASMTNAETLQSRAGGGYQFADNHRLKISVLQDWEVVQPLMTEVHWQLQNPCGCFAADLWSVISAEEGVSIGASVTTTPIF